VKLQLQSAVKLSLRNTIFDFPVGFAMAISLNPGQTADRFI